MTPTQKVVVCTMCFCVMRDAHNVQLVFFVYKSCCVCVCTPIVICGLRDVYDAEYKRCCVCVYADVSFVWAA